MSFFEDIIANTNKKKILKEVQKSKTKDKPFKTLSTKQKDELLETMAKMLGLIE